VAGFGLLKLRPWARPLQLAVSIASLINFPFGTLIGGLTIAYLLQPPVKTLFSPKRTEELTPAERAHLVQVHSLGKVTAIVVACVVGIGGIGYVGIVAAIAIPNLLNAIDRGKQKRTMADIRSMGTALEAYREERGGFPEADSPEALEAALVPDYLPSPRRLDGWQHPIAVFSTAETYRIESYGKDGVDGEDPGGEMQQFADDIVFTEGEFFQYPAGLQK
jgi:general secretion pathway protein G